MHLPDVVPELVKEAYFEILIPKRWNLYPYKPICIHFAGTGDHVSRRISTLFTTFLIFDISIFGEDVM